MSGLPHPTLALAILGCIPGCYGSSSVLDREDGGRDSEPRYDAPLPDAWLTPEPCSEGIRRSTVDVPPLADTDFRAWAWVGGHGDRVVVAQVDRVSGASRARLTVTDLEGTRLRSSDVALPTSAETWFPYALRGTSPYEVLYVRSGDPFAVVATFDEAGSGTAIIPADAGAASTVNGAAAAASGFVAFVSRGTDTVLASIRPEGVTFQPLPLGFPTGASLTDADADGMVFGVALRRDDHVLVAIRIDTNLVPFELVTADLAALDTDHQSVSISRTRRGVVIGAAVSRPTAGVRFVWLDGLALAAQLDIPVVGWMTPIGAAGMAPEMLAFEGQWGGTRTLSVGLAPTPGELIGASRPLVNGLDLPDSSQHGHAWESAPGVISIVYPRSPGAEVVTLCAAL